MKTFKWFILTTLTVVFFSCSTNYDETLDKEATLLDSQTRGNTSQNDSAEGGGMGATIVPREVITQEVVFTEERKEEDESESVPNDTIPNDSIKIKSF